MVNDNSLTALAPIVLFVYNRPWHTLQTLEALSQNAEAKESDLYIYADGPKESASAEDLQKIQETRTIIRQKQWCRNVYFVESDFNKGLADSVITGTTEIVNKYESVITLEDDVIVSQYFLAYMNKGLEKYRDADSVYMVAGYIFPVKKIKQKHSSFFLPLTSTQAWGTWKRAWDHFDPLAGGFEVLKTNQELRSRFNLDNSFDYSSMLMQQMETNSISSWAIRWWWTVFKKNGIVLYPDKSLVKNIGWDNSGSHSGHINPFEHTKWDCNYSIDIFPNSIDNNCVNFKYLKVYLANINNTQKNNLFNLIGFLKKKLNK